jgi:hypothetical protein
MIPTGLSGPTFEESSRCVLAGLADTAPSSCCSSSNSAGAERFLELSVPLLCFSFIFVTTAGVGAGVGIALDGEAAVAATVDGRGAASAGGAGGVIVSWVREGVGVCDSRAMFWLGGCGG